MSDGRCPHSRKALAERRTVYETALGTGIQLQRKREEVAAAERELDSCLQHGWELEPQLPWQMWGEGWEEIYG